MADKIDPGDTIQVGNTYATATQQKNYLRVVG